MSTSVIPDSMLIHTQEPPEEWVTSLRSVDPIRENASYLHLHWLGGWAQRWCLYQMVPLWTYSVADEAMLLEELTGPDPDTLPEASTFVSHLQWTLWQTHKRLAEPFWILQGTKGGHLVRYNREQALAAKAARLPQTPPDVGSLPYAPWDARSERQILRHNLLIADFDLLKGLKGKARKDAAMKRYREQFIAFMGEQAEEDSDHFVRAFKTGEADAVLPISDKDWDREDELASQSYVETGRYHPQTL